MKLLLVGIDAADWTLLQQLVDRRLMPRLQRLLTHGVTGGLQPVRPLDSTALWTSIVTGKRATRHGVLNSVEADPAGAWIRPTSRSALRARPLWSILSRAGVRTHAIGWPASHPAEPINGVAVSNRFADEEAPHSVHPSRLTGHFAGFRLAPSDIDAASLLTLLPRAAELNPTGNRQLYSVAQFFAYTASLHATATWALEHEPWDFAAVRYEGLAKLHGVFGNAPAATVPGESRRDAELFGEVIPNAYRFFDMLLRRLLELAGDDASVILLSQPGPPDARNITTPRRAQPAPGWFVAAGPGFRSDLHLSTACVCDVTPTILHMYGLRAGAEFDGRPLNEILVDGGAVTSEWPRADSECHTHEANVSCDAGISALSDDSVAHLLALGYRDRPDEHLQLAIAELEQLRLWRLAEAWIDCDEMDRATMVLEELVATSPPSTSARSMLAEACFRAGKYEACRRLILSLISEGIDTALGRVGLAALDLVEDQSESAVAHLQRAEAIGDASAAVWELVGRLYLGMRRRHDAGRAFDNAITADHTRASAHEGRAIACLLAGDAANGERHARQAIVLDPNSPDARCRLGVALARQERTDEAIAAFREAVVRQPQGAVTAHRHLASLLELRGEHALALHHRALASGESASRRRLPWDFEWITDVWCE